MSGIFILNKDIYFQLSKEYCSDPRFYGYWNALKPNFGGLNLIETISKINSGNIDELINKINLNKYDSLLGFFKNQRKNHLIIYGTALFSYVFVAIRIQIQFEYLSKVIDKKNINTLFFSYEEILEAHNLLSKEIKSLNNDVYELSNQPSITNLLLFFLSYSFFPEKVSIIDKRRRQINIKEIYEKIKKIKTYKLQDVKDEKFSFKNHKNKMDLNLVNTTSLYERISNKLKPTESNYIKFFRSEINIFFRKSFSLNMDDIEFSLLDIILPEVDLSLLDQLIRKIKGISFIWKKITISSLHFSSIKVRLLLNELRNVNLDECKIKLYNEHGSSFFKTSHHNYSFDEDVFNAITVYRKNYPLKKFHPYEYGITTQKIPFVIPIIRYFSIKKKFPIIIGSQIFNDLKNVNYRYLLYTNYLKKSYLSLFNLLSEESNNIGFLPSKNVRSRNYKDPIYKLVLQSDFKILTNYRSALIDASCLIITYPETTLADAIMMRIPFLLFCDIDQFPLHYNSKYWYQKLYEFGVAYKLDEFQKLQKMITSGKIYKLWRDSKFKKFINLFENFIL